MIVPRRVAKKLVDEYLVRVAAAEVLDAGDLERVRDELLDESALVLRGTENAEQKARRYLTEGRLVVENVNRQTGLVVATCAGEEGDYKLGHDPGKNEWRCTCPAPRKCSHLIALRLVVRLGS